MGSDASTSCCGGAGLVALLLGGAGHPLDHGVYVLEVARVRGEVDKDLLVGLLLAELEAPDAEVVLDVPDPGVAGAARGRGLLALLGLLELAEDLGVRLVHHVRQDVEPPPVRHAQGDHGRADVGGGTDDPVKHRNDHVVPLDREPLLAEERLVEELLEGVYPREPLAEAASRSHPSIVLSKRPDSTDSRSQNLSSGSWTCPKS